LEIEQLEAKKEREIKDLKKRRMYSPQK